MMNDHTASFYGRPNTILHPNSTGAVSSASRKLMTFSGLELSRSQRSDPRTMHDACNGRAVSRLRRDGGLSTRT
jgi:hypothetical protein